MVVAVLLLASKGLASDFWLNFFWLLQTVNASKVVSAKGLADFFADQIDLKAM